MLLDQLEESAQPRFGSRGEVIASEIKRGILSGRYKAGAALTEKAIAEELAPRRPPSGTR